jgi:hypothetical protein
MSQENPSSGQSATPAPLSCPRCETRTVDWCCWELIDLKARVVERDETMRQILAAFPGKTEAAIRDTCRRYGIPRPRPGVRTRRVKCAACTTMFAPSEPGQRACDACDPPIVHARAA